MSALALQQAALLDALFAWPAADAMKNIAILAIDPGARGLKAYQSNGHLMAERVLGAAYPVLAQMVGDESFGDLARALWHAHPPVCGDLGRWGEALPAFVETSAQLRDEPYLADVARLEWCLHLCATAPDAAANPASVALLTQHDPADLTLLLAPGCAVVSSRWPIASIVSAHLDGSPSLAELGEMLRNRVAQNAVVWRKGFQPSARLTLPGEAGLLDALLFGDSLGQALEREGCAALDFAQWFPHAIQTGLVLGVAPHTPSTPKETT
ncbi:MAG: putative DNA-binding domain-containing protein [Rhodoferax sp.]|nr:putative DNA-binding domain-containing protein [Rhodoferax sp.]